MTRAALVELVRRSREAARALFLPDRPGPLTGLHAIATGLGRFFVDSAEAPRVALATIGFDAQLAGDPDALEPETLRAVLGRVAIDAPRAFEPLLRAAFPDLDVWPRVISRLGTRSVAPPAGAELRRLVASDASALAALDPALAWIHATNGGPEGVADSGLAFGAFVEGRLASVALPFLRGLRFEDLGVVTEVAFRRRGLSAACASAVAADVRKRGREPSWSTAPSNEASVAVARALGATHERDDVLWVPRARPE